MGDPGNGSAGIVLRCVPGRGGRRPLPGPRRSSKPGRTGRQRDSLAACAAAALLLAISLGVEARRPQRRLLPASSTRRSGASGSTARWATARPSLSSAWPSRSRIGPACQPGHVDRMVAGAILAVAGFGVTGHAATAEPRWLTAPLLVLHVLCAAYWTGALVPLYRRLGREPGRVVAPVVARFSRLALGIVPVLFAAGLIIAFVQVRRWKD